MKVETYLESVIIAWKESYKKDETVQNIFKCHIYREKSQNKPLNLCECNDGSKFQSINHAINQAKIYVKTCEENNW